MEDLTNFITSEGAELVTDSRAVALAFRKRHKNVLQIIDRMRVSPLPEVARHSGLNFQPASFLDAQGKQRPMYRMTDKGLSELAMGFSGDMARVIRIRFLDAFEEVANRLARAERSITERLLEFERREIPSRIKGQIGSRLMHDRKREKPDLEAEEALLKSIAQPKLPLGEPDADSSPRGDGSTMH